MREMKKGIWFALTAVVAMTMMYTVTRVIVRGSRPIRPAFGADDHENNNFNSSPVDGSAVELDDWLS